MNSNIVYRTPFRVLPPEALKTGHPRTGRIHDAGMSLPSRQRRRIALETVERTAAELPVEIRKAAEAVPVHFPARPDAQTAAELGEDLLGLFSGEAIHESGETLLPTPPQIHLYLDNLWWEADEDPDHFREEVRITYLHELGHYLGWDEDDMVERGID